MVPPIFRRFSTETRPPSRRSKIIHDFFFRIGYNVPRHLKFTVWEGPHLRKLNAAIDRFAYSHPRFGIPNLMKFLVGIMAVVFVLDLFSNG